MTLSELCIRRPVMTVLLSISVVIAGLLAYDKLPISALPSFNTPVINVSASLAGASPDTMAVSVATPLEKQFSTIAGLSTITSSSSQGSTSITLEFDPSRDIDAAAVDVQAALLRAQRSLPAEMTSLPAYRKVNPADAPILLLALTSPSLSLPQLNDYAENLVSPTLSTLNGVAQVQLFGQRRFAVRIQVDPDKLAARDLTFEELSAALKNANANTPLGVMQGPKQTLTISANRQLMNAAEIAPLIVASRNGVPVRLADVASVSDSVETLTSASWLYDGGHTGQLGRGRAGAKGERSIVLAVLKQPNANTVAVVDAIKAALPRLTAQMPASIRVEPLNDRANSIRAAMHDVQFTLGLTVALVVLVIFLFLRRASATLIPSVTLPISLVGTLGLMYWLGYSLDNISLLGLTLAVGLVVDDAIVVLENIVRHVEDGMAPLEAALKGSREVGFTIVSISLSLVAVFIPIFFMPGVIGLLFHEFAVVVSLAILVSALASLTLIPLLASRFVKPHHEARPGWLERRFEAAFQALLAAYRVTLDAALRHRRIVLAVFLATFVGSVWFFQSIPKGFFPSEDIGQVSVNIDASDDTAFDVTQATVQRLAEIVRANPAVASVTAAASGSGGRMFVNLKPRAQRADMDTVLESLRRDVRGVAGVSVFFSPIQNLRLGGRASKARYQYTLQSVRGDELGVWAERLRLALASEPLFRDVNSDVQVKGLVARVDIDRDRANLLGVALSDIRTGLYNAFGQRQVSTIYTASGDYAVLMEIAPGFRVDERMVGRIQVRSKTGALVPLANLVTVSRVAGPTSVNHQGQLQAVTLSFNLAPGATLGDATETLQSVQRRLGMPGTILTAFAGDAAAFQQTQHSQVVLIVAALVVIYVLLGVLYESYIHPLTILSGLPSAAVGALLALRLLGMELTVIAAIGILMLIGIVKKNAIMMVDFAIEARKQGLPPQDAIRQACLLRFRPILMTTLAAMMGALSIAAGYGAGSELRQPLGVAVVGGLIFSQLITLYITPVIYLYLEKLRRHKPARELAAQG